MLTYLHSRRRFDLPCSILMMLSAMVTSAVPNAHAELMPLIDVIAVTGDPLPGGGPGTYDTVLFPPILNDQGDATVYATLENTATLGDRALFRGNASGLTQVIRFGDSLPGVIETFQGLRNVVLNNHGQIAAEGGTNGGADNMILIFDDQTGPQIVAKVGDPPPVGSGNFVDFSVPRFNNSGDVAFAVSFTQFGSPSSGVYLGDASGLTEIRRGALDGTPSLNDSGQLFLTVSGTGGSMSFYDGTDIHLVASNGDPIPGGTGTIGQFNQASINESGQFAITARVAPQGGGSSRGGLLFFDPVDGLTDALPLDTPAPDGNGDFDDINLPFLNDSGMMAFSATLANTAAGNGDNTAAYLLNGPGGDPITIAHELQRPPNQNGVFDRFTGIALNELGHAAFDARLRATSNGLVNALYFFDPKVGLTEIIREGDSFLGSTIAAITFEAGTESSQFGIPANEGSGFNNLDQIAFSFRLADGRQGVAIATVVPEPSPWILLTTALACAMIAKFRRGRSRQSDVGANPNRAEPACAMNQCGLVATGATPPNEGELPCPPQAHIRLATGARRS